MIVEVIIDALVGLVKILFDWIDFPDIPGEVFEILNSFFEVLKIGFQIISVFLDMEYVTIMIPMVIAIINFDHLYHFAMWLLRKLPIGIE